MKKLTVLLLSMLILCSCNVPKGTDIQPTAEPVIEATEEILPEPTEEPTPLPALTKIILAGGTGSGNEALLRQALPAALEGKFDFAVVEDQNIPEDADYVIIPEISDGTNGLVGRFPGKKFILLGGKEDRISGAWTIRYDRNALPFLAGMATSANAFDWRGAGLIPNDSVIYGEHFEEAYINGGHYLCGNCSPNQPPYVNFPLTVSLPGNSPAESWNAGIDEVQKSFIYTMFVSEEASQIDVYQKLVESNVKMLGLTQPPSGLENNWLATINYDWAGTIEEIVTRCGNGENEGILPLQLLIIPGQLHEDFSSGKAEQLRQAYADIMSGLLYPLTTDNSY